MMADGHDLTEIHRMEGQFHLCKKHAEIPITLACSRCKDVYCTSCFDSPTKCPSTGNTIAATATVSTSLYGQHVL